jgi:arylsulfatase A-like enzyme
MAARMNILVILLDSLRRDYLGCYHDLPRREGSLSRPVQTSHLDALAAQSAVFTRAMVNSFPCGPFRRDAWTGRIEFPHRGWGPLLDTDYTHAQALGEAGYVTMFITDNYPLVDSGYAIQRSYTEVPVSRSPGNYQRNFAGWHLVRGNQSDRWWPADRAVTLPCAPEKIRGGAHRMELYLQQSYGRRWEREWFGPQVFQAAIDWLEENARRPFFLWIDCFNTHEPFDPPRHYEDLYDPDYAGERLIFPQYSHVSLYRPEEVAHLRAMYAGLVTMMDVWIGRLLESLRILRLLDRTLILFTSDHGFLLGDRGLVGKSWGGDPENFLWQGIADIPLLIRHPEGAAAGERIDCLVQTVDLYATILDVAGIRSPEGIDGRSLLPVVRGEQRLVRELGLYGTHAPLVHVTDGRYTLFLSDPAGPSGPPRLYDLESDPYQQQDLLSQEPDVARRLHAFAEQEMARRGAAPKVLEFVRRSRAALG